MKKFTVWLVCLLVAWLMAFPAMAEDDAIRPRLLDTCALTLSKQPTNIKSITPMPDGGVAVFYLTSAPKKGQQEYRLDVFAVDGTRLLAKNLGRSKVAESESGPFPYGQIILQSDRFLCEYYPDITTMEVYRQTAYRYNGKAIGKEKTRRLKFGLATYARPVGDFMVRTLAHAGEEPYPTAIPYRTTELIHIPTGQSVSLLLYDWSFCSFADDRGCLFIAQCNENDNLELRRYDPADGMAETVTEFDKACFDGINNPTVGSAVYMDGKAYLEIYRWNEAPLILIIDTEQGAITASSTLHVAEDSGYFVDLQWAGEVLLAVDGWHMDETLQCMLYRADILHADLTHTPLALAYEDCIFMHADGASGVLTTVAVNADGASFVLCRYAISAP